MSVLSQRVRILAVSRVRSMLLCVLAILGIGSPVIAAPPSGMLIFSRTAGFRHDSIAVGAESLIRIGREMGLEVDWSQESEVFTDEQLSRYGVIVFLSTTGDVLNDEQQGAMERFVRSGRGWVGIHAAADTEYDWAWYMGLVGAAFKTHPATQRATINVVDRTHPATRHLPARWIRTDEWYDYQKSPRGMVHVLMTMDESSYEGGIMSKEPPFDHPIAWCHLYDGGRSFYTGLGHTKESFAEPAFLEHLKGGIAWALGIDASASHDAGGTIDENYEVVTIDDATLDPMELAVAGDGRVVYIERGGLVKVWSEELGVRIAGALNVTTELEDGLLGMTLDPDFLENGWIYIYYSPVGTKSLNRLSRFTLLDDVLDPTSERVLLDVPTQRLECCHSGGSVAFGPDGLLYLSTGDNTNPFASDGFAPIDQREGRMPWDAQKSSASTSDLRGKILRIRPLREGGYEIPEGNLFPRDGTEGRPEIYVMGCRNPFRIGIDPVRNWLYFGDVGPDSDSESAERGPRGHDEFNQARRAGNFGWPYVIANNKPYRAYDFATKKSGEHFDVAAPINDSPNRSGARILPPAVPAWVWYPYGRSAEFPVMGSGGRCAMGGPTYRASWLRERHGALSPHALPPSMDGATFMYEWARGRLYAVRTDDDGGVLEIEPFLSSVPFLRPHDLEMGPDGRLYLIEWGSEFGGLNTDSRISRIDYHASGNRPPRVVASASVTNGAVPLRVEFDASASVARSRAGGNGPLSIEWDFDGDGATDAKGIRAAHTFTEPGVRRVRVRATDSGGIAGEGHITIHAGNTAPRLRFESPAQGTLVREGERVRYRLRVEDQEDGSKIDLARVSVELGLKRGNLVTVIDRASDLSGELLLGPEPEGDPNTKPQIVLRASYTDGGAPGVGALTGRADVTLQLRRIEAERATTSKGTQVETKSDSTGAQTTALAFIENEDNASFSPVRMDGVRAIRVRIASATRGGVIEARLGGVKGQLIGIIEVPTTGGWTTWQEIEAPVVSPGGTHDLWLVFRGGPGYLFNLDWIELVTE
ncbi:MAG: ThuA domain-containing protein [Phycisphaeraceae bacterium]|nr:MAG: ThuA domain-containing protein [Phycisphaeraceae bacterium]